MKTVQIKKGMQFTYECEPSKRSQALKDLRKHILQYGEASREIVSQFVRGHGFQSHVGGRHVAVIQDGVRLAIITSKSHPDFN